MLPSLDGLEICREIRRDSGVVIVILTAKAETEDIVAGLEVGADDYVTKPFDIDKANRSPASRTAQNVHHAKRGRGWW